MVYCGDTGKGTNMKMAVNVLLGILMEGLCEAINFGQTCGLSVPAMFDAILSGPLACPLFNQKTEYAPNQLFPPQFPLKHMSKDIRFALDMAEETGAAIPVVEPFLISLTRLYQKA